MAKDIIFRQKPRFANTREYVKKHLEINNIVEKMKGHICGATTIQNAALILRHDFPFATGILICEALQETFLVSFEEAKKCLT